MYNQMITVDGYDRNHWSNDERSEWLEHFEGLADRIFQPTLEPRERGVIAVPFFGYDPSEQVSADTSPPKRFDLLHVGHNWWRWFEVSNHLLPAIERIRARLNGICFVGLWWDEVPPWVRELEVEIAFQVEPDRFRRAGVQVRPPVPYTQVIPVMSESRVNVMTQRPLFRYLRFFTSKYFEIFCADSIPLVMLEPERAEAVYGPAGRELALFGQIDEKLLDVLEQPGKYWEIVREVRYHLTTYHSYRNRVRELVAALGD
jgi:hypothetical protein